MDHDHQDRIKQRAHDIWEREGRPEGRDADHWSQAEEELRHEMSAEPPADDQAQPELAQSPAPAKPKRAPRKTTKTEKADATPDGA
ncbi:DUF2934 domain-containing protein [uncultured Paracoccus sp.]|uniref:DUF2934 domain-containing protein n=1 Tax=uncultured Paracoccus sp. TaxID=189685 RepID=UPI0025EB4720|nr:DUF2934 domain-containing protein [uncultured Paracoccus sp.]